MVGLILNKFDPNEDFTVFIYACLEGLGGILVQKNHIIVYELRNIKNHERNYVVHDIELDAVIHALKSVDISYEGKYLLLLLAI